MKMAKIVSFAFGGLMLIGGIHSFVTGTSDPIVQGIYAITLGMWYFLIGISMYHIPKK